MTTDKPRRGPPSARRRGRHGGPGSERQSRRRGDRAGVDGGRDGRYWMFGRHAVAAACANPERQVHRLLAVEAEHWRERHAAVEAASRETIANLLPPGVVHQGVAALVAPLPALGLEETCDPDAAEGAAGPRTTSLVVALDQVEDPQNVGTIVRSAAAFGARAVILPERHAPPESGLMARAAVGMLERVPLVRVVNLSRALETLAGLGYWRYGLAADGAAPLQTVQWSDHIVLVVGAEGRGLRRLTAEACDSLVSIAMAPGVESLNVSAATAIALHEIYRIKH